MKPLRISMPSLPTRDPNLPVLPPIPFKTAVETLSGFLEQGQGKTLVLTGAGVSKGTALNLRSPLNYDRCVRPDLCCVWC